MKDLRIDEELRAVIPPLDTDAYKALELSLLKDGYKGAPICVWGDVIVDGHNRYEICTKHNIPFEVQEMEFASKDDVIQWMLQTQIARRNLNKAQMIQIVERYRPKIEEQARKNQMSGLKQNANDTVLEKVPKRESIHTSEVLADMASVSEKYYRNCVKVLESDDEPLKQKMLNGEISIGAAFKKLNKNKKDKPNGSPEKSEEQNTSDENAFDKETKQLSSLKKIFYDSYEPLKSALKWAEKKQYISSSGNDRSGTIGSDIYNFMDALDYFDQILDNMDCIDSLDTNTILTKK